MARFQEFDAAELSLSRYVIGLTRDAPFIAVPVFLSRGVHALGEDEGRAAGVVGGNQPEVPVGQARVISGRRTHLGLAHRLREGDLDQSRSPLRVASSAATASCAQRWALAPNGLVGLSVHNLGDLFGVKAMPLYNHVANKATSATVIPIVSAALVLLGALVMACGRNFPPRRELEELAPSTLIAPSS